MAELVTVCQCNIHDGGRWTERDRGAVTYDTAQRFGREVARKSSMYPPVSVVGMQELLGEEDRLAIQGFLAGETGEDWQSSRTAQGIDGASGIGFFWRSDLVESSDLCDLGAVELDRLDNGFVISFAARMFRSHDAEFVVMTGKLVWEDGVIGGQPASESVRVAEAERLRFWARGLPAVPHIITTDLNSPYHSPTWHEMDREYVDPGSGHTHNSFLGVALGLVGRRLDYIWLDRRSVCSGDAALVGNERLSGHFGSDHRAVTATIRLGRSEE